MDLLANLGATALHLRYNAATDCFAALSFINLDWVQRIVDHLPLPASGAFLEGGGTPSPRPESGCRRDA